MKEVLELIEQKIERYKELALYLEHQRLTAKRLQFNTEVQKFDNDKDWVAEINSLLDEVKIKVQNSLKQ